MMNAMSDDPILIAGGGIAGLAAAIGLDRSGKSVALFEQAQAFEEVGAGLQMSPNAVRALQSLGAWEAVESACVVPTEIHVRDGRSGALLQRLRLGKPFEARFGAPYRVCHRADLLAGLVDTARQRPGIALHTGTRAVSMADTGGGAHLALANGNEERGAAAIAADGIRSILRQAICGVVEPVFRGHAIYRALIPISDVPTSVEADCVTLWLFPGGHVVHYAVSNWRQFNIVAAVDSPEPDRGWSTPGEARELRAIFGTSAEALTDIIATPAIWLKWQAADLPPLRRWAAGNLVVAGDAAHGTLPYLAQGAAMSLEDACVLAACVTEGSSLAEAFHRFEGLRRGRVERIQIASRRQRQIYHASGMMAMARNLALRLGGEAAMLRQTSWIYGWTP
jgi:salicylate hydroxylase